MIFAMMLTRVDGYGQGGGRGKCCERRARPKHHTAAAKVLIDPVITVFMSQAVDRENDNSISFLGT